MSKVENKVEEQGCQDYSEAIENRKLDDEDLLKYQAEMYKLILQNQTEMYENILDNQDRVIQSMSKDQDIMITLAGVIAGIITVIDYIKYKNFIVLLVGIALIMTVIIFVCIDFKK